MLNNREVLFAPRYAVFSAIALLIITCSTQVRADDDVTIVAPAASTSSATPKTTAPDGTPVVHKSSHKKKSHATATAASGGTDAAATASASATSSSGTAATAKTTTVAAKTPEAPVKKTPVKPAATPVVAEHHTAPAPAVSAPMKTVVNYTTPRSSLVEASPVVATAGPTVETALPVPRYSNLDDGGGPIPASATFSKVKSHASYDPTTTDSYSSHIRTPSSSDDFVFTNFSRRAKNTYPWKTGIITTMFWIGEGGSSISSTDNKSSSWDENWVSSNRGGDNPYDRNGYNPAGHAPTLNPFYIALPFNDLAFPDKARRWLPSGWYRRPKDGKQVSACKDRWIQIKNAQGRSCYAQWEDVGPLRYDHAEYVFGSDRPDTYTRAGLDVSPAVAQYLNIDGKNRITSWRFVDDEDVPPGAWLKYDEQAVIFTALQQLKNSHSDAPLPIQRSEEPIDDPQTIDTNKKKVGAAKG